MKNINTCINIRIRYMGNIIQKQVSPFINIAKQRKFFIFHLKLWQGEIEKH